MKILLVDDDRDLVDLMAFALSRAGFQVVVALSGEAALRQVDEQSPNLVVLDVNLASANEGFDVLQAIRKKLETPVIMLSGRAAEDDKVRGLTLGADDYLTKPFSHRELIARIHARLKHTSNGAVPVRPVQDVLTVGPLTMNLAEHSVTKDGEKIHLTVTEFRLLHYLMLNAGNTIPNRAILRQVWGQDDSGASELVRVTVHRLRRKLVDDSNSPQLLHTIPGVGVLLKA